ncbi:hypothetical protein F6455_02885 [Proteobacteria bacterium 005FR1]|nr:hypothetical protein [Proteobacteria bacterium 005FR1]
MSTVWIGMLAGFIATAVLSVFMLMQSAMKLMPQMQMIPILASVMGTNRVMGWLVHFLMGTVVYGGFYGWLFVPAVNDYEFWIPGLALGLIGWLLAMVTVMPIAGKGAFAMNAGVMAPMMSLLMHVVFGVLLGWIYGLIVTMS